MPKRQNTKRVESEEVQGEDSYVILKRPLYGEGKETLERYNKALLLEDEEEKRRLTEEFLVARVVDWNWVDDAGDPLPKPSDDPSVLDQLTDREMDFLTRHGILPPDKETLGNSVAP